MRFKSKLRRCTVTDGPPLEGEWEPENSHYTVSETSGRKGAVDGETRGSCILRWDLVLLSRSGQFWAGLSPLRLRSAKGLHRVTRVHVPPGPLLRDSLSGRTMLGSSSERGNPFNPRVKHRRSHLPSYSLLNVTLQQCLGIQPNTFTSTPRWGISPPPHLQRLNGSVPPQPRCGLREEGAGVFPAPRRRLWQFLRQGSGGGA